MLEHACCQGYDVTTCRLLSVRNSLAGTWFTCTSVQLVISCLDAIDVSPHPAEMRTPLSFHKNRSCMPLNPLDAREALGINYIYARGLLRVKLYARGSLRVKPLV